MVQGRNDRKAFRNGHRSLQMQVEGIDDLGGGNVQDGAAWSNCAGSESQQNRGGASDGNAGGGLDAGAEIRCIPANEGGAQVGQRAVAEIEQGEGQVSGGLGHDTEIEGLVVHQFRAKGWHERETIHRIRNHPVGVELVSAYIEVSGFTRIAQLLQVLGNTRGGELHVEALVAELRR